MKQKILDICMLCHLQQSLPAAPAPLLSQAMLYLDGSGTNRLASMALGITCAVAQIKSLVFLSQCDRIRG